MMSPSGPGFATLALHAGAPDGFTPPAFTGMGADIEQAVALLGVPGFGNDFSRTIDPNVALVEERVAALEGGSAALALASGDAAQFLVFHMLLQPGDELVVSGKRESAGPQFIDACESFGFALRFADPARPESFERASSPKARAIFVQSFAGPAGTIVDLAAIARIAKKARLPLIVDNTLATPYLLRPIDFGADIIIHSATKFLGGHEAVTGGFIVDAGTFSFVEDARYPRLSAPRPECGGLILAETFGNFAFAMAARLMGLAEFGPVLSPANALLVLNGIETLALRMQRHSDNALRVAEHLARHKAISSVSYAALRKDPSQGLAKLYCPKGAGAMLTVQIAGGASAAERFLSRLKLFSALDDIGDARSRASATGDLVRLSIGLEDVCDIIADLNQALES